MVVVIVVFQATSLCTTARKERVSVSTSHRGISTGCGYVAVVQVVKARYVTQIIPPTPSVPVVYYRVSVSTSHRGISTGCGYVAVVQVVKARYVTQIIPPPLAYQ